MAGLVQSIIALKLAGYNIKIKAEIYVICLILLVYVILYKAFRYLVRAAQLFYEKSAYISFGMVGGMYEKSLPVIVAYLL